MAEAIGTDERHIKAVSCTNCATIVRYTESEVKRIDGTDYGGGPDGCTYITCPKCSKRITLTSW